MRKKTLDGLVKLADWQATVSRHSCQKQQDLRDQALREQEAIQQYIAAYDTVVAGEESVPVMLAHKRTFVSKLSDQLAQLGEHVVECSNRLDDASAKHRLDTQKVTALRLMQDGEKERADLQLGRSEQAEQDEVASRPATTDVQTVERGGYDHV